MQLTGTSIHQVAVGLGSLWFTRNLEKTPTMLVQIQFGPSPDLKTNKHNIPRELETLATSQDCK